MSYFQEVDAWLNELLKPLPVFPEGEEERFRAEIKKKLLESYRNGQKAPLNAVKRGSTRGQGK